MADENQAESQQATPETTHFGIFEPEASETPAPQPTTPASEAAPTEAPDAAATPEPDDSHREAEARLSSAWDQLTEQHRHLRQQQQELEQRSRKIADLEELRRKAQLDPAAALLDLGVDPLGYLDQEQAAPDHGKTIEELRAELRSLKESQEQRDKAQAAEAQARQFAAAMKERADAAPILSQLAQDNPESVAQELQSYMASRQRLGHKVTFEDAIAAAEKAQREHLLSGVTALRQMLGEDAFAQALGFTPAAAAPKQPTASPASPTTLSSKGVASDVSRAVHEMTDEEREQEVLRALREGVPE